MVDYSKLPACPVQTCLEFISDKWKKGLDDWN